jgi:hypothetical protein
MEERGMMMGMFGGVGVGVTGAGAGGAGGEVETLGGG